MKQQLLLLEDIKGLGRSGDVVSAKAGFIRNFLLPQKKAVIADRLTLKLQTQLRQEREKKAAVDRKEAEAFAEKLKGVVLTTEVKVDTTGKMFGSVTTLDIARLLQEKGYEVDRKNVALVQPIKTIGVHIIELRLSEGVPGKISLEIQPEGGPIAAPLPVEPPAEVEAEPAE